jgi:NarL family two-component system response regulator YdfI
MIRILIRASPIAQSRLMGFLGEHDAFELAEGSADVDADVLLVEAESFADAGAREGFDWAVSGGPVVLLLRDFSINVVGQALRAGVKAVLPSSASESEIVAAVEAAAAGLVVMEASDVDALLRAPNLVSETGSLLEALTPREIEVLQLLASGLGNKEIAARLEISEHTVKFHVASIMGKLGATSRTEAVTLGIRRGLIML